MSIYARPFPLPEGADARGSPDASSEVDGDEIARAEVRPRRVTGLELGATPELEYGAPPASDDRLFPSLETGVIELEEIEEAAPAEREEPLIDPSDIEAAFDRLVAETAPARAAARVSVAHGTSTAADRAAVRATFEDLAAVHVTPLRNLMLEVRWGKASTRLIGLARPALQSLRAMANELDLEELVRALDGYDAALGAVAASGAPLISGELRESLLGAYFPLMSGFAGAFGIEGGRERREPIIIDALLDPVPGIDQDVLDRLCLVGLGRLEPLLDARADEIAVVADIPRTTAERIVARVAALVKAAPPGLPRRIEAWLKPRASGRRAAPATLVDWLTAELLRDQTVLKLRRGEAVPGSELEGVDLTRAQLEGAALEGADLTCVKLAHANLRRANLRKACLRAIDLGGADLCHADLEGADLRGAKLRGARLEGANLARANLTSADLGGASLEGARLSFATLSFAKLGRVDLAGASLVHADLEQAWLVGATGAGADLSGAHLKGALLEQASFRAARLADANLERARASNASFAGSDLGGCDLRGADLAGVDLSDASLKGAILDDATLTGAKIGGLAPTGAPARRLRADWLEGAADTPIAVLLTGAAQTQVAKGGSRYFGPGDRLRDAILEFGDRAEVAIDTLCENCTFWLGAGAELVIGPSAVLADCRILGPADLVVRGQFFGRGPGITGPRSLTVAASGAVVSTIEQAPGGTRFQFERGARLRLHIARAAPRDPQPTGSFT